MWALLQEKYSSCESFVTSLEKFSCMVKLLMAFNQKKNKCDNTSSKRSALIVWYARFLTFDKDGASDLHRATVTN